MNAAFFDCFGIFAFAYIVIISIMQIRAKKVLSNKFYYLLLAIGILGLVVDLAMVYFAYLR